MPRVRILFYVGVDKASHRPLTSSLYIPVFHVDPNSNLGKIILVIGIPLFCAFLTFQCRAFYFSFKSLSWSTVQGVIIDSRNDKVYTMEGGHDQARIRYRYIVNKVVYENDTISFGLFRGMMTWGDAERNLHEFPNGAGVAVYYDPSQPGKSSLRRGGIGWEDCFMFPVCICGIWMGLKHFTTFISKFVLG